MFNSDAAVYANTPAVRVFARGLVVGEVAYHRHFADLNDTRARITRHHYDVRGGLSRSIDPRLDPLGRANFIYINALVGNALRTQSVDAGIAIALNDSAGRPLLNVKNVDNHPGERDNYSQAVTRTFFYEDVPGAGRPLYVAEHTADGVRCITERFVYAGLDVKEQARNLAGQCIRRYDTAGVMVRDRMALTGAELSVERRLLLHGDDKQTDVDWRGDDNAAWDSYLEPIKQSHKTCFTTDVFGAQVLMTDAAGNQQRLGYDVAGRLTGSWFSRMGAAERVIVQSSVYTAAGQKLSEVHGNGVITDYSYMPITQRPAGIRCARPAGHKAGRKILQDLRYAYDPVGNVRSERNEAESVRYWRNQAVVAERTCRYDSLYQLVRATGRESVDVGLRTRDQPGHVAFDSATYTNYSRTYTYDIAGNLSRVDHNAPANNCQYSRKITVSDRSNRAVSSDLAETPSAVEALFRPGGQQALLAPGQHLAWTPRGELQLVAPIVREGRPDDSEFYRYGSQSQRVLKVSIACTVSRLRIQRVTYLPGLELRCSANEFRLEEELRVMTAAEAGRAQVRLLHWPAGAPEGMANDQLRYSYGDLLGSSTLEVDGAGSLISQEEYYPFGGTALWAGRSELEASYKTIRYSGQERDATGLYYFGRRYYQSWVGRWLSTDPVGTVDGLNLYCMVRNNPTTLKDVDGEQSFEGAFGEEFKVLDSVLMFPKIFEGEQAGVVFKGNIEATAVKRRTTVFWQRNVPAYQPTESESIIGPAGGVQDVYGPEAQYALGMQVTEQFAKDIKRGTYSVVAGGSEMPLLASNLDEHFNVQQRGVISTIAHQAHLADTWKLLHGIEPVGGLVDDSGLMRAAWVPAPSSEPEHKIQVEKGENPLVRVSSRQRYMLRNIISGELNGNLDVITEQATRLSLTVVDGVDIYSHQSEHPTVQVIRIVHTSEPIVPRHSMYSNLRFWKRNSAPKV